LHITLGTSCHEQVIVVLHTPQHCRIICSKIIISSLNITRF
jgi:hypothetical protein